MAKAYLDFLESVQSRKLSSEVLPLLKTLSEREGKTDEELTVKDLATAIYKNFNEESLVAAFQNKALREGCVDYGSEESAKHLKVFKLLETVYLKIFRDFSAKFRPADRAAQLSMAEDLLMKFPGLSCLKQWAGMMDLLKKKNNLRLDVDRYDRRLTELAKSFESKQKLLADLERAKEIFNKMTSQVPPSLEELGEAYDIYRVHRLVNNPQDNANVVNYIASIVNDQAQCQEEISKLSSDRDIAQTSMAVYDEALDQLIQSPVLDEVLSGLLAHQRVLEKKIELLRIMTESVPEVTNYLADLGSQQAMLKEGVGQQEGAGAPKFPVKLDQPDRGVLEVRGFFAHDKKLEDEELQEQQDGEKANLFHR